MKASLSATALVASIQFAWRSWFPRPAAAAEAAAAPDLSIGTVRAQARIRLLTGMLLLCSAASAHAQITALPWYTPFNEHNTGVVSPAKTITVSNAGNQPLTVSAMSTVNPVFQRSGGSCGAVPFTVAAQSGCTLQYTFLTYTTGTFSDTVTLSVTGSDPALFLMNGVGVQAQLNILPSGGLRFFGTTPVGTSSAERMVELSNVGDGSMQVTSITPATTPFLRSGGTCETPPFTLSRQSSCTLGYRFAPVQIGNSQLQVIRFETSLGSRSQDLQGDASQGSQTISFPAQAARTYGPGYSFPVSPPATADSGLAIVYASTTPTVCTVSGSMVGVVAVGTCTLNANQPGNASWAAAAQQTQSIAIARASQTLTFPAQTESSRTLVAGGSFAIAPPATSTTPNAGQPIVYSSLTASVCTVSGSTVTMLAQGACTLAANQAGNSNYNAATQVTVSVQLALFAQGFDTSP